jgi:hypothetical protein
MYRLRESTVSPRRLRLAVTLQEDCNGAGPILPVPKTKKIAFWDWGAVFHTDLYGPVKMWRKKKKKENFWAGGAPRLRTVFGIGCN